MKDSNIDANTLTLSCISTQGNGLINRSVAKAEIKNRRIFKVQFTDDENWIFQALPVVEFHFAFIIIAYSEKNKRAFPFYLSRTFINY